MTVTGALLFDQCRQFLTDGALPLGGGLVTFYKAGTNTKQDTFSDQAFMNPNPNGITLNAAGRFADPDTGEPISIYVDPSKAFKIRVQDSDGVDVKGWPLDNVTALGFNPSTLVETDTSGSQVAYPLATIFKKQGIYLDQFFPDDGKDYGDGVNNVFAILQTAINETAAAKQRLILPVPSNFYKLSHASGVGIFTPDHTYVEHLEGAWIRPDTQTAGGGWFSNRNGTPEDITQFAWLNPQIDLSDQDKTDPLFKGDNIFGFATGPGSGATVKVRGIRIEGGIFRGARAQFKISGGPGGKDINFEEGAIDCVCDGNRHEDSAYATFISPTQNIIGGLTDTGRKFITDIRFTNQHVKQCGWAFQAFSDNQVVGNIPPSDAGEQSVLWHGVVVDSGHYPDRTPGSGALANPHQKTGIFAVEGVSNVRIEAKVSNSNGFPSSTYPGGGTAFPDTYPPIGGDVSLHTEYVGGGLSGNVGAVLWGWGRNLIANIEANGNYDDLWNFSRIRAAVANANAYASKQYATGAFNQNINITHSGNIKSIVRTGQPNYTGLAVATSANTIQLQVSDRPSRDNELIGLYVFITAGTGKGQFSQIYGYDSATGIVTVGSAFSTVPDTSSMYYIGSITNSGGSVAATSTNSVTITPVLNAQNNYFIGYEFIPTDGANAGQVLVVSASDGTTGVLTFLTNFGSTQLVGGDWILASKVRPGDTDISANVTVTCGAVSDLPVHESANIYSNIILDCKNGGAIGAFGTVPQGNLVDVSNGYNTLSGANGERIIAGIVRPRILRGKSYTLADDTVLVLDVSAHSFGAVIIHSNTSLLSNAVRYRANSTATTAVLWGETVSGMSTIFAVTTGALTNGTSDGTDGAFNVSCTNAGLLYIKNRRGVSIDFTVRFED